MKGKVSRWWLVVTLLAGVGASVFVVGWLRTPDVEKIVRGIGKYDAREGQRMFDRQCWGCHTTVVAPSLRDAVVMARSGHEGVHALVESIVYPGAVIKPSREVAAGYYMPDFHLDEWQVGCIARYLVEECDLKHLDK